MKYTTEKKKTIVLYILDKIASGTKGLSNVVADAFGISTNTVHTYINELIDEGIIAKRKRGEYELATQRNKYSFLRSQGELEIDTQAFDLCLSKQISHLSENVQHIWAYAMSEMVNNVIDHSNAEQMFVIVEQNYLQTSVGIIDDGIGIFEKIKNHFSLPNLDEAICELFKGKLTTDADNHSGEGIFFTSHLMDKFTLLSERVVFTRDDFVDADYELDNLEKGTLVTMSLHNHSKKTTKSVFDRFSDIEEGFIKTQIPIAHIFSGSGPISRSEARRLGELISKFKEIELDFTNVEEVGQAFSHELFIVWQTRNPDVTLNILNACKDVDSMIRRVKNTK